MTGYFQSGRPFFEWIASASGRETVMGVAAAAGGCSAILYWIPHAPAIDKTKDMLQMYRGGMPFAPPEPVKDLIGETLADCGVTEIDSRRIRWFTAFGFDPIHMGQVSFKKGSIIGLPKPFYYKDVDEIDKNDIKISRNKTVPWRSDEGAALMDSLILSDEAKKFAIAAEIHQVCWQEVVLKLLLCAFPIPVAATAAAHINDKFNLFRSPLRYRMCMYATLGFICFSTAMLAFDWITRYFQTEADAEVSSMGEDYAQGGIEYYGKCLLRNRALRDLLGKTGQRSYTENGNVNHWFRRSDVPLTERRATCQKQLEALREKARQEPEDGKKAENDITPTQVLDQRSSVLSLADPSEIFTGVHSTMTGRIKPQVKEVKVLTSASPPAS